MSEIKVSVEHNGTTYSAEVNTIESTTLGVEDHGIFTAYLHCKGAGTGIGVGGYTLDAFDQARDRRVGHGFGAEWIMQVLRIVGVETWEKLRGARVLVLFARELHWGQSALGIANVDTGEALIFADLAAEWFGGDEE